MGRVGYWERGGGGEFFKQDAATEGCCAHTVRTQFLELYILLGLAFNTYWLTPQVSGVLWVHSCSPWWPRRLWDSVEAWGPTV